MTDLVSFSDLLACWEIGPIRSITEKAREESAPGSVTFIETESGARYVLKRETIRHTMQREYSLLAKLAEQGVPVAVPIRTRSGESNVQVGEEFFDLSPYLPGTVYTDHYAPDGEARARQFGEAIARLHLGLRSCDPIVSIPYMDLPGDIGRCNPVVRSIWPPNQRPPGPILEELEAGLADCYARLPKQLLHRDAHPGNMLFQDGQLTGWIDFEMMEGGPRLFDLCYCSTCLLMNGLDDPARRQVWHRLVRALVEGYDSVSPLMPVERGAIRMMQMAIEVLFIAWFAHNNYSALAARNIEALAWLYENPYEL